MVLGLGSWELVFVGLALLVLFGPEHVPQVIRRAGELQARVEQALQQLDSAVEQEQQNEDEDEPPVAQNRDELPSSSTPNGEG